MRGLLTILLLVGLLPLPFASAARYQEIIPSAGWDVWTIENFGASVSAFSYASTGRPAMVGVAILDDDGNLLERWYGYVAGGRASVEARGPVGDELSYDMNHANHGFFGGIGISLRPTVSRVHVVTWAAGDDIHRQVVLTNDVSATPVITLRARGEGAFYLTAADFHGVASAGAQATLVESDAAVLASRTLDVTGTFFGHIGARAPPSPTQLIRVTMPDGATRSCPCDFAATTTPPGSFRVDYTGASVGLSEPIIGGADVRLPSPLWP